MEAPMCRLCKTRHYGQCKSYDASEMKSIAEDAVAPKKAPFGSRKAPAKNLMDEIMDRAAELEGKTLRQADRLNGKSRKFTDEGPKVPASKRLPHRPGALVELDTDTVAEIKAYAAEVHADLVKTQYVDPMLQAIAEQKPPAWWTAMHEPRDPEMEARILESQARRAAMTIQDRLRELSRDDDSYVIELCADAADRIDELEAKLATKREYMRTYMKAKRDGKKNSFPSESKE